MQIIFFLLIALNSKLEIFHGIGGFLHPRGAISNTIALCELPHFLHFTILNFIIIPGGPVVGNCYPTSLELRTVGKK